MGEIWKEWGNVLGCGGGKERCVGGVESVLGCGKVWVGVWKCVWRVGKCVWDVGRGVERVLRWGQCGDCGEVWGEMWDNLGERGNVGRRVVSRFGTPTFPDHNSPDP